MLSTHVFIWYVNYKKWCASIDTTPMSYTAWMAEPITNKLLWAD